MSMQYKGKEYNTIQIGMNDFQTAEAQIAEVKQQEIRAAQDKAEEAKYGPGYWVEADRGMHPYWVSPKQAYEERQRLEATKKLQKQQIAAMAAQKAYEGTPEGMYEKSLNVELPKAIAEARLASSQAQAAKEKLERASDDSPTKLLLKSQYDLLQQDSLSAANKVQIHEKLQKQLKEQYPDITKVAARTPAPAPAATAPAVPVAPDPTSPTSPTPAADLDTYTPAPATAPAVPVAPDPAAPTSPSPARDLDTYTPARAEVATAPTAPTAPAPEPIVPEPSHAASRVAQVLQATEESLAPLTTAPRLVGGHHHQLGIRPIIRASSADSSQSNPGLMDDLATRLTDIVKAHTTYPDSTSQRVPEFNLVELRNSIMKEPGDMSITVMTPIVNKDGSQMMDSSTPPEPLYDVVKFKKNKDILSIDHENSNIKSHDIEGACSTMDSRVKREIISHKIQKQQEQMRERFGGEHSSPLSRPAPVINLDRRQSHSNGLG